MPKVENEIDQLQTLGVLKRSAPCCRLGLEHLRGIVLW